MIPKKPVVILCRDCWKPKESCVCHKADVSMRFYAGDLLNPIDAILQQQDRDAWCILLTEQDRLFLKQIHISAE